MGSQTGRNFSQEFISAWPYNSSSMTTNNIALIWPARSHEIPEAVDAYGWLIGSWDLDVRRFGVNGAEHAASGEVHFAWVLEGRAMQDVWIMPRRQERTPQLGKTFNTYGTTLRVWDSSVQAWRVTWINPVTGARDELVGRRCGKDIVQIGTHSDGTPIRWIFTDITPDSFRWVGEVLEADGITWRLEAEFLARRSGLLGCDRSIAANSSPVSTFASS
jgi:hypothetical protein